MAAIKVTLRQKLIGKGRKSLYLDFYPAIIRDGKETRREFLKMYVLEKPKTPIDKAGNSDTLRLAEAIRQKRENELNKPEIYNDYEREQLRKKELGERCFVAYFRAMAEKRNKSNHDNWMAALKYLESYTKGSVKFADLNEPLFEDFKHHLLTTKSNRSDKTTISQNTASAYFNKVKAALRQAFKDGILQTDLNGKISPIKATETRREYLTLDELNQLAKTPCNNDLLKRAALFSALTGMAHKEIENLRWKDISLTNNKEYLILSKRQKTQRDNYLPISEQAYSFTEGTPNPKNMQQDKKVFEGLKYSAYQNKHLFQWIGAAGITKEITFHCFRHTYATLQLSKGADIYTVSKMLGHKDLKTTQVYAKIMDEAKRKAADNIKLDL